MSLNDLPDNSRVWIFPFETALSGAQQATLEKQLTDFVSSWKAHGAPVRGAAELVAGQFLIVAADKDLTHVSGCSIDSLFRAVTSSAQSCGANVAGPQIVFYREEQAVRGVSREEFSTLCSNGKVTRQTPVFDATLTDLAAIRSGRLEVPLEKSWHARAFF